MTASCSTTGVDQLALLADRSLHPVGPGTHHWLIRVIPNQSEPGQLEIGLHSLEGIADHPADYLLGFVAPDEWVAIGVAATGRARDIGEADKEQPWASLVVMVVDRSGDCAGTVRRLDGSEPLQVSDAEGSLADLCRRAIDVPTAPPEAPPVAWWARVWLDSLFRAALAEPSRRWNWAAVVSHHPLHLTGDRFPDLVNAVGDVTDWGMLRRTEADRSDGWLAAWMDDGCYARWLLDEHRDPAELLADLSSLLPDSVVRQLIAALDLWAVRR